MVGMAVFSKESSGVPSEPGKALAGILKRTIDPGREPYAVLSDYPEMNLSPNRISKRCTQ